MQRHISSPVCVAVQVGSGFCPHNPLPAPRRYYPLHPLTSFEPSVVGSTIRQCRDDDFRRHVGMPTPGITSNYIHRPRR